MGLGLIFKHHHRPALAAATAADADARCGYIFIPKFAIETLGVHNAPLNSN